MIFGLMIQFLINRGTGVYFELGVPPAQIDAWTYVTKCYCDLDRLQAGNEGSGLMNESE
ncbi:MAG: hypothetical protein NPIRA04_31220 [Nitrospirales bacterium]|nr:MAG: hypothetical protein NPIRA04_31220 [Nitrospirales bacterium]